jgi:hypothetical protein
MARVNAFGTGYEQEDVDEIVSPFFSLVVVLIYSYVLDI